MSLLDVRASIVTTLKAALPPGVAVEAHRGRFDSAAEVKRFATRAPAVLVACLRVSVKAPGSGTAMLPAAWGLFVITTDKPAVPRDAGAIALVEQCLLVASGNFWGRDDLGAPYQLDARNLYSGAIDNLGVAMWAISFDQLVTEPAISDTEIGVFATFTQQIDMAPADGQIDIYETDQLPQ